MLDRRQSFVSRGDYANAGSQVMRPLPEKRGLMDTPINPLLRSEAAKCALIILTKCATIPLTKASVSNKSIEWQRGVYEVI